MSTPRIYVASLADYNAGRLVGKWIEVDGKDAEEIGEEVQQMLATSREPVAEEWAIHDFENFGRFKVSEWSDFRTIAVLGQVWVNIEEEKWLALTYWVDEGVEQLSDYWDDPDGLIEAFEEKYRGHWSSFKEYVIESEYGDLYLGLNSMREAMRGADRQVSWTASGNPHEEMYNRLSSYIDWDMVTRDTEHYHDVERADGGGVWVFDEN